MAAKIKKLTDSELQNVEMEKISKEKVVPNYFVDSFGILHKVWIYFPFVFTNIDETGWNLIIIN